MKLEHIALYVSDLEAAKRFFTKYLGARANDGYTNPRSGLRTFFLTFDDGARLEIMAKPNIGEVGTKEARLGYAHVAFQLGSREAVDALTERLRKDDYAVRSGPRVTGDGYYESCVVAIEGNLIELTA